MGYDKKSLLDSEHDRLLARMEAGSSAATRYARFGARADMTSFETHPLYRQMTAQRKVASLVGIEDPHYRIHDGAVGASTWMNGIERINFASYDYLNLSRHPLILDAVDEATRRFGTSVSASRISAGERAVHVQLEAALANIYETEAAIAFVSGHGGVVSTLATLLGPKDLILFDAFSHNCILMGASLSGAARRSFPHNDLAALEAILDEERDRFERVMVVCEGLFSMDGDGPDLPRLVAIKKRHEAILMVDDAHGLGVLGPTGRGIFEHQGVAPAEIGLNIQLCRQRLRRTQSA